MKETESREMPVRTTRDLLEIIFRHRRKALFFFLIVSVSTIVTLAFIPETYTSTSKLIVHRGRESVFLDPTAATGETLPLYKEWVSEINSELEILSSHELVVEVVENLGADFFLNTSADSSGWLSWIRKTLNPEQFVFFQKLKSILKVKENEHQKQTGKIIQNIIDNLEINARPKSDIIVVTYTGRTPELSRRVVSELIDTYLDRRIALHRIPGAYQFFTRQTERLLTELKQNEDQLLTVKKQVEVISLDEERHTLQQTLSTTRSEQLQTQALLSAAKARVKTIQYMLEQQQFPGRSLKNGSIMDPVDYKALQSTLRLEEASLAGLSAQNEEFNNQIKGLRNEMTSIESLEPDMLRLEREKELLENQYLKYSDNREQARINEELETKKFSNVSIIQHATLPRRPSPSGKPLKSAAAVFLGLIGAVSITFGADYLDPTLHSSTEIAEKLGRNVLAEIPLMPNRQLDPAYTAATRKKRKGLNILYSGRTLKNDAQEHLQELFLRLLSQKKPEKNRPFIIGLTSSSGGEGVSTLAGKLAASFARNERFSRTLLLDANPVEHSNQLVKQRSDLPFTYEQMRATSGSDEKENQILTASKAIERLTEARREPFDVIFVDIPPLDESEYAFQVSTLPDLLVLVVSCGHTSWRKVAWAVNLLDHTNAALCGIVLNRRHYVMPHWLYQRL